MAKRPAEVLEFLMKPDNEEQLLSLMEKVEPYWNS
jgi:YesN/AraC family two-component response regulator